MKLRRVEIKRFRGIKELTWDIGGDLVCLLGPGDSTKTTILDAIELALSPRWNIQFDDTEFYELKAEEPIEITVTVGDLLEEYKSDAKFGLLARGWTSDEELNDEPEEGDELILSIRLRIDNTLEPEWRVVNDRNPDGKAISARDREKLGCTRLGSYLDRHFSWARGSILSRLTSNGENIAGVLAAATRACREEIANIDPQVLAKLTQAANDAKDAGKQFGVAPTTGLRPHLDFQSVSVNVGALTLHDGEVPFRQAGLGTRRLLAMAMQRELGSEGELILIDEIEFGLEPHRIRRLLSVLCGRGTGIAGHVLMTTHSPVVLEELKAEQLRVVRSRNGATEVLTVPTELQPIVLKTSEAFLARKVLVCEGKTEIGLCRRLDHCWSETGPSFGLSGIALANGRGHEAAIITHAFAQLGYEVALLADSDQTLNPDAAVLASAGVQLFQWEGNTCIEQRISLDLPVEALILVVRLAMDNKSVESVRDSVQSRLSSSGTRLDSDPNNWAAAYSEQELRDAIGRAAQECEWFKRVDLASGLGEIIIDYTDSIESTNLGVTINAIRDWAHGDGISGENSG